MPGKHTNWCAAPLMVLIAATAGGCEGYRPSYPRGFPPFDTVEIGNCPDISGQYSNWLGGSQLPQDDLWLSYHLWYGEEDRLHYDADHVTILQPDPDTIEFIAQLEDGRSTRRRLSRDDNEFSCNKGFVVIYTPLDASTAVGAPVVIVSWKWNLIRFARTTDGSLAVEFVSKKFSLANFVFPLGFAEGTWYVYPAAAQAAVKQQSARP